MSAPASKPAKPAKQLPLTDVGVLSRACLRAIDRIDLDTRAGKHPRRAANAAMNRISRIPREVWNRVLTPGEAALEMLRVEVSLKRRDPAPATAPAEKPRDA